MSSVPARVDGAASVTLTALSLSQAAVLGSEWDRLALTPAEPNPFFERWFLLPAWEQLGGSGDIALIVGRDGPRLVGLMPLARLRRYYHLPLPNLSTWLHGNCFLGSPLVAPGYEEQWWTALLAHCDADAGSAMFLHLPFLLEDGGLHRALGAVLHRQRRRGAVVHREDRAMLASSENSHAYLASALSAKKRKELRRQWQRLREVGEVRFERRNDNDGLDGWIDAFLTLERSGWKGTSGSALALAEDTTALFRQSLRGAASQNRLERLALMVDDEPIAMLATFIAPPGAFAFKTAFDERYARYSPGVLLQRENLALLDHPDIDWTDSCAAAGHPMIEHIWRERRAMVRMSVAIGGSLRRAAFGAILAAETAKARRKVQP